MTQHKNVPRSLHILQPSFTIIKWKSLSSVWLFVTPWTVVHGKNTGMGSHSLLQGIFPTQGSNPGFPHCGQILYHLSHEGSPRILEWVAYHFSSRSPWPKNWTKVSCITGGFFTRWATRETLVTFSTSPKERKMCPLLPTKEEPYPPLFSLTCFSLWEERSLTGQRLLE